MQTSTPDRLSELLTASPDRSLRLPLMVFSHLRWGFVFQRPQHLMTRLAQHFDVYFIEEPVFADAEPALMSATHQNGVEVLTPRTKEFASGFHDSQLNAMKPLIADFMASRGITQPLVWLYTPMALPLVADLEPRAVIYDCMDDLASFKFAPPELAAREQALMALADLVLTGGPSLYEARQGQHPNLHFTAVLSEPESANGTATPDIKHRRHGWVHEAVLADHPDLSAFEVYAAGPPAMIEAIRSTFPRHGLAPERLYFDSFDYAPDTLSRIDPKR